MNEKHQQTENEDVSSDLVDSAEVTADVTDKISEETENKPKVFISLNNF